MYFEKTIPLSAESFTTSGVTGGGVGGRVPPETSDREISADEEKRQGKKGEQGKGVKIQKKRWKMWKLKMEGG